MTSIAPLTPVEMCITVSVESTFYLPSHIWDLGLFPEDARTKCLWELMAQDDIIKTLEDPDDGNIACINWDPSLAEHSRLYPLHTAGTGDCLLNAASLAMWGVQDHVQEGNPQNTFAVLRLALSLTLRHVGPVLKDRWLFERLQLSEGDSPSGLLRRVVALEKEWEDALVDASLPRRSLLPEHIFVLAQVLCRPIIVYGPSIINGVQYPWNELHSGIYLPVLHPPAKCHRNPICMVYTAGHFSAAVMAAPVEPGKQRPLDLVSLDKAGVASIIQAPRRAAWTEAQMQAKRQSKQNNSPSKPTTPALVDRQLWLMACLAAVQGEPEPIRAWRRATGDVSRQLTLEEAEELNEMWQEQDPKGQSSGPKFLTGDDIEGLIVRYENWNVYEMLADSTIVEPRLLKRSASQLHLSTRSAANRVRRIARGALVVPPLQGVLRLFVQQPQQPWQAPVLWKEAWVEVDDKALVCWDMNFGCKGARLQTVALDTAVLLSPASFGDWQVGVIAAAESIVPPFRLWLKARDTLAAHHWRSSLFERQTLAQIPSTPPASCDRSSRPVFSAYIPLVQSDGALLRLRFLKPEEDGAELLAEYMDCFAAGPSCILTARQQCMPYSPIVSEFVQTYLEVLQQRLHHGTLSTKSSSFSIPNGIRAEGEMPAAIADSLRSSPLFAASNPKLGSRDQISSSKPRPQVPPAVTSAAPPPSHQPQNFASTTPAPRASSHPPQNFSSTMPHHSSSSDQTQPRSSTMPATSAQIRHKQTYSSPMLSAPAPSDTLPQSLSQSPPPDIHPQGSRPQPHALTEGISSHVGWAGYEFSDGMPKLAMTGFTSPYASSTAASYYSQMPMLPHVNPTARRGPLMQRPVPWGSPTVGPTMPLAHPGPLFTHAKDTKGPT